MAMSPFEQRKLGYGAQYEDTTYSYKTCLPVWFFLEWYATPGLGKVTIYAFASSEPAKVQYTYVPVFRFTTNH